MLIIQDNKTKMQDSIPKLQGETGIMMEWKKPKFAAMFAWHGHVKIDAFHRRK